MDRENRGRGLEDLVAHIEEIIAGAGFKVVRNQKVYDEDDGQQLAEFDVIVEGKVGTSEVRILFECRDRPSQGGGNAEWIRSVYGRQLEYHFNKVIAVSSTGFTKSAVKAAAKLGVELRTVEELNRESIKDWFDFQEIGITTRKYSLINVIFVISPDDIKEETQQGVQRCLDGKTGNDAILYCLDGSRISAQEACNSAQTTTLKDFMFDGVEVGGPIVRKEFPVGYPDKRGQYRLFTEHGFVAVSQITFEMDLSIVRNAIPVSAGQMSRYRTDKRAIADVATFSYENNDFSLKFSFSKVKETGATTVNIRRTVRT